MRVFRISLTILAVLGAAACGRRVATVDISPKKVKIYGIENTQRLSARPLDRKGRPIEEGSITWSSSRNNVAAIDASGRLTAKGEGRAMITATFRDVSSQVPVDVIDVKTIEITPSNLQLIGPPGTQFPLHLTAKTSKGGPIDAAVQWTSSKTGVMTVDSKGVITSVTPGSAMVLAKLGDLQAACDVTVVVRELSRLELRPATAILRAGDVQKFEVVGYGPDGRSIEGLSTVFQSSDLAVAKVDSIGLAMGVAPGTAIIRATLGSVTAEATLLVN